MIKNIIYKYKIQCIIAVSILILGVLLFVNHDDKKTPVIASALEIKDDEKDTSNLETYSVDIKGAVKEPGVYKIVKGSIIDDAITLAGGFKKDAYTKNINLSKKVSDEMVIYIYTKSEYNKLNKTEEKVSVTTKDCTTSSSSYDISNCVTNGSSTIVSYSNTSENSSNQNIEEDNGPKLININTASKEELMTLTGIGESKALCIIEYREQNNGFKSIEEIKNISGIGEASFAKIKDFITI